MVHCLYENIHVNILCNFKSNMHESLCQFKKQVMAIWNWSSGELCGPWASCFSSDKLDGLYGLRHYSVLKGLEFYGLRRLVYLLQLAGG